MTESIKIVQSPFFLETHGSIIAMLLKLNEFYISEETLIQLMLSLITSSLVARRTGC